MAKGRREKEGDDVCFEKKKKNARNEISRHMCQSNPNWDNHFALTQGLFICTVKEESAK